MPTTPDGGSNDDRSELPEPPLQQHGDPLMAAAEGHPDGSDASRHGFGASQGSAEDAGEPPVETPEQSTDDTDRGWGERPDADDDERFLREKPPHY
jgi:hypothetical protein